MRRRNAYILGACFLLTVAGYVAWQLQPLYLPMKIEYADNIPPDAVAVIEKWRETEPFLQPEPMELVDVVELLAKPWDAHRVAYATRTISYGGETNDEIVVLDSPCGCYGSFAKVDGVWRKQ